MVPPHRNGHILYMGKKGGGGRGHANIEHWKNALKGGKCSNAMRIENEWKEESRSHQLIGGVGAKKAAAQGEGDGRVESDEADWRPRE